MVYKYQKETFAHLEETRKRLEKLTDARKSLKIGIIRDEFLNNNGTAYYEDTRDLYFCLNHENGIVVTTFKTISDDGYASSYGINMDTAFVRLDTNLFLKLNDFIDNIYKHKQEREEFHEKLNKELIAINNSL